MRFRIADRTYNSAFVDRLTLRHYMEMERHTAELNHPMTWLQIRDMVERVGKLDPDVVEEDPEFLWFMAVVIWASRYEAGEQISLAEAVDFPMGDFEPLPDPADLRRPGGGVGGPRKARSAAGSGRAGKRPVKRTQAAPKASAKRSSSD